jgi:putative tryptophan/tyrosine transport system substrate-binding protein
MKRRQFITLLGGAATTWPLAARAQQPERVRRIGVLMGTEPDNQDSQARVRLFQQRLRQLGWIDGHNVQFDMRWGRSDREETGKYAKALIELSPDVVLATGSSVVEKALQATRTVPIVFLNVADPVGAGFVDSLARPGGNATGFVLFEYGLAGKWLELLKETAPAVKRAAVLRDPEITAGIGQFAAIQNAAPALGLEVSPVNVRDAVEIERAITVFVRSGVGGLIVTASALATTHRHLIIGLAARHRLPAVYWRRHLVEIGGLISYGPDIADQYRSAAAYVDRVLKGEKPADLPVQAPTKYELAINLKTAKTLGLALPPALLTRADEVIE